MKTTICPPATGFAENRAMPVPAAQGKIRLVARNSPRHVLVVDDEPLIRWSVAESLADLGYDVEQAPDACSALRKVTSTSSPFDVVVLDLRLPDMDDLSLLATLRQLLPDASLVLMTAFGNPDVIADARAMHVPVLQKPFELDELKAVVLQSESNFN